jgi:hypothetical protein
VLIGESHDNENPNEAALITIPEEFITFLNAFLDCTEPSLQPGSKRAWMAVAFFNYDGGGRLDIAVAEKPVRTQWGKESEDLKSTFTRT